MRASTGVLPVIVSVAEGSNGDGEGLPQWVQGVLHHLRLVADRKPDDVKAQQFPQHKPTTDSSPVFSIGSATTLNLTLAFQQNIHSLRRRNSRPVFITPVEDHEGV